MAGKHQEVGPEVLQVDRKVGDCLRGIDQDERARGGYGGRHFADGDHRAEGIRDPSDGEQLGARAEQGGEGPAVEGAVFQAGDHLEARAGPLAEHLPGHDVRVVFQRRDENVVALRDAAGQGEDVGDEVDAVGGAGGENDFLARRGVEVGRHGVPRLFVGVGGGAGEVVGAAVDVRVERLVIMARGVHHRARLLGGGGVVEVNQRVAVDLAVEDREIVVDGLERQHGGGGGGRVAAGGRGPRFPRGQGVRRGGSPQRKKCAELPPLASALAPGEKPALNPPAACIY